MNPEQMDALERRKAQLLQAAALIFGTRYAGSVATAVDIAMSIEECIEKRVQ